MGSILAGETTRSSFKGQLYPQAPQPVERIPQ
jgi:hypothetical protein